MDLGRRLPALLLLMACTAQPPKIAGTWRNAEGLTLAVGRELAGVVNQLRPCAPVLDVRVHRDPFDAYAIRFVPEQPVFFSPAQKPAFGDSDFFCASPDSVPMCQFCLIDGDEMRCESPVQEISGKAGVVTHDCRWTRVSTSSTSSVTPMLEPGRRCPADMGGCLGRPDAGIQDAGPVD